MHTNHSSKEDALTWLALKNGSEAAFEHLYDQYFPKLYNYGMRICQDKALVKDCIQNVFVELWHKRSGLSTVTSVKYYLFTCLRRRLIKELSRQTKYIHSQEPDEEYHFEVTFSHEFLLITSQISKENQERLQQAFDSLTKRQKEAVFLRFYENMDYEHIAELLSMKEVKYARTLIYRALDVLKGSIRKLATI
ncbi:sigma-70 family RNA polymerase sigma factor [Rhodocytophaga aerolata]|uniref:Sigma-70 family RNA polymerase sigma factor n=1 Tax=Rhodocytophaga aerolata TaxID=455078 RepID=A0ABT8QXZ5_9BACT|nr:sigma-70 family RNA polymerase sigma factor [Rhodocytophaga aerolata]MDO1444711.1 sigma-70 family RNA polymerase sigma factor [Rhodocytophaga aerolata]